MTSEHSPDSESVQKPILSRRFQTTIALSVVAGVVVYMAGAFYADIDEVGRRASMIGIDIWLLILGASLINYGLRFLRWKLFIERLGGRIPPFRHALIYVTGFALTTTPGKVGEAIRAMYMTRYGVSVRDAVAALFTERLIDLLTILGMAVLAIELMTGGPVVVLAAVAIIVAATTVIRSSLPDIVADRVIRLWPQGRVGSLTGKAIGLIHASRQLFDARTLVWANIVGILAWGAEGVGLYILLAGLGADLPVFTVVGIYGASVLIGALSFLPGGLGSTEVSMTAMLIAVGLDPSTAVLATIVCRVVTLWFSVILGLAAMVIAESTERAHGY